MQNNALTCHVLSLPNTPSSAYYTLSHFAQKIRNLCWMLKYKGHKVHYYGYEACEVDVDEKVIVGDMDILTEAYPRNAAEFGHIDINQALDNPDGVEYLEKHWALTTTYAVKKRVQPGDFVFWMLPMCGQRAAYDELIDLPVRHVEPGIGYIGAFLPYKVFQSAYIRDFHYGMYHANSMWYNILGETSQKERPHGSHAMHTYINWEQTPDLRDAVIPNSYDLSQFDYRKKKDDYLLCLSRVLIGKGIRHAVNVAERLNMKLIVAGPGDFEEAVGKKPGQNIEVLGPVGVDDRRELLSKAKALLSLSDIDETFGGAPIEAMISGTVPITANTGGFRENIKNGYNGFLVDVKNINQIISAVESVSFISPENLRDSGLRFSRELNAARHNAYYQNIDSVLRQGDRAALLEIPAWNDYHNPLEWPREVRVAIDEEENSCDKDS